MHEHAARSNKGYLSHLLAIHGEVALDEGRKIVAVLAHKLNGRISVCLVIVLPPV